MIDAAVEALLLVLQPGRLIWIFLGICVGLIVGVLPGMGGTVGMAVLLPFAFGMEPVTGIAFLVGMAAVIHCSDTIPSVLLGVPGSAGAQATIMDGYPLARQGRAGEALSASFISSMFGGVFGALVLFGALWFARPFLLALATPELFMLTMLGLSMVGILSRGAPLAGLISGGIGLVLGTIGGAQGAPGYRYTFGTLYLLDGLPLVVLALGLFALPELLDLMVLKTKISQVSAVVGGKMDGVRAAWKHRRLVLQGSIIGPIIGMIPGLGGSVVDWIAYGAAAQTTKNSETFGTGDIRGVIAPEAANNAKEGGALVPALIFGIPGSGTTAMLLGGLIILGVPPGPRLLTDNTALVLAIVWTLAIANVIATGMLFALTKQIAKITQVPSTWLVPFVVVLLAIASYQATRHYGDLVAFLLIGALGWAMKQAAWPRAPMLIGFVLSASSERFFFISMNVYGATWITRPGVIIIAVLTVLLIIGGVITQSKKKPAKPGSVGPKGPSAQQAGG
jgi:putative tricarboxylic transport membrane protein